MTPEDVYALLVEANPVPGPELLRAPRTATTHPLRMGSEPMYTIEERELEAATPSQRPRRSALALALAAAVVLVIALGVLIAQRSEDEPEVPADSIPDATLPAPPTAEEAALATAREFQERVNAGDVEAVMAMTNPDYSVVDADRNMWEANAVWHRVGDPPSIGGCVVVDPGTLYVEVECSIRQNEAVFEVLGVADLVAPYRVFPDQTVQWRPWRGGDFGAVNRAYAEYLRIHRPDAYAEACDPLAYERGTIISDGGLALTPECAALAAPLADEVATWIEAGRPGS